MSCLESVKIRYRYVKEKLQGTKFDNIIWLINITPNLAGFSMRNNQVSAPFFIVHFSMLFYVYALGTAVYQYKFAKGLEDLINSYVNVSLLILITNISGWWVMKRPILRQVLEKLEICDQLARVNPKFIEVYKKRTKLVKMIVIGFYTSQFINASLVYLPNRVDVNNDYSMVSCVGIEPLTISPNREICLAILCAQEFSIMTCCLNYQALLVCLIGQTANMYHMLSLEMLAFNDYKNLQETKEEARELLPSLISRHVLLLDAFDRLKALYSFPLGIDFGSNAVCIVLFFYLSLEQWLIFMPVVVYCFLVFFLYCFLFQKVTNAAEEFEQAIYGCGWENFDVKEKKIVYVMLRQAQQPVVLRAANIVPVNIYTFATTLQAIFKFVTVVKV